MTVSLSKGRGIHTPLLVVLALAAGCREAPTGGRIVIGESTDISTLLPVIAGSQLDAEVGAQLYLSLNQARLEDGELDYFAGDLALAEDWQLTPDSVTLIYDLRDDARWSDGEPVDAGDVVFTFELVRVPEIASPYGTVWERLDSVTIPAEGFVAFHFKRRYPGMLYDTGIGIVPEHIFREHISDQATLAGHPTLVDPAAGLVVSGPYRVAERAPGERLVLERNPRAVAAPATDTIVFRILPDPMTRLIELRNGALDVAGPLPLAQADELAEDPGLRVEIVEDRFYDYIAWNGAAFAPFADTEIRRALSLAIDRRGVLEGLGIETFADPAAGPFPPILTGLADPELEPDPYAPDSARAILERKGWSDRDGDGVLDRDGERFRFTLLTQAGNARRESAAEIIQAGLAAIGIEMRIRSLEFNTLMSAAFQDRNFEALLSGWQVGLQPDDIVGFFWPADHPYNFTGYSSAALDTIIPRAQAAATGEEAAPHWRAAARVIADAGPYAFLWFYDDAEGVSERVRDTRIDTYGIYQNLHQWRIDR